MRRAPLLLAAVLAVALVGVGATAAPASQATASGGDASPDLGHQVLPSGDGWASSGTGTTGGVLADADHVFTVANRQELIAALGGDNASNRSNAMEPHAEDRLRARHHRRQRRRRGPAARL